MLSNNVDLDSILVENAGNTMFFKNIQEDLFAMSARIKSQMDRGVSPQDFDVLQSLLVSIESAKEFINSLE